MSKGRNKNTGAHSSTPITIQQNNATMDTEETIVSNNPYNVLSDNDEGNDNNSNVNKPVNKTNKYYPPITVCGSQLNDLTTLIRSVNIDQYKIKLTSFGIRIQCSQPADHELLLKTLTEKNIHHFTYETEENRLLKFVLQGLFEIDTNEIKKEIELNGIKDVVEVKAMRVNNKRYDDHCTYLVKFKRNSINLQQLRQIRSLFHVVVRWENFRRRTNGPPMCSRCQNYGHAASHCKLAIRCVFCGEAHTSKTCDLITSNEIQTKSKCCHCGGPHKASHPLCPERRRYSSLQTKITKRNKSKHSGKNVAFNYDEDFPQVLRFSDSNAEIQENSHFSHQNQATYSNAASSSSTNKKQRDDNTPLKQNDTLFSSDEIIGLTREIISNLSQCKTRTEQFNIILKLTTKYLYE